jgi:hypothetical protein
MELREVDGKTINCTRTGLSSDLKDCGVRSNWYAYVLVGAISAITPTGKTKKDSNRAGGGFPPKSTASLDGPHVAGCVPAADRRWGIVGLSFLRAETGKPFVLYSP